MIDTERGKAGKARRRGGLPDQARAAVAARKTVGAIGRPYRFPVLFPRRSCLELTLLLEKAATVGQLYEDRRTMRHLQTKNL